MFIRNKSLDVILAGFDRMVTELDTFIGKKRDAIITNADKITALETESDAHQADLERAQRVVKKIIGLTA